LIFGLLLFCKNEPFSYVMAIKILNQLLYILKPYTAIFPLLGILLFVVHYSNTVVSEDIIAVKN